MVAFVRNCSVKMTLRLFYFSVIMTMVPTLLRQFSRSLQIKEIITNASYDIVCWIAKIYQSITVKKGWLLTYYDTFVIAKKAADVAQKKENSWTIVSFIHNGSEITIWMGYSFKTKAQNPKQSNIFKKRTSFLNLKLQIIRLAQGNWSCTPTH